jgi:hypothetical protein
MRFVVSWSAGDESGSTDYTVPVQCASDKRLKEYIVNSVLMSVREGDWMVKLFGDDYQVTDFYDPSTCEVMMPEIHALEDWFDWNMEVVK